MQGAEIKGVALKGGIGIGGNLAGGHRDRGNLAGGKGIGVAFQGA